VSHLCLRSNVKYLQELKKGAATKVQTIVARIKSIAVPESALVSAANIELKVLSEVRTEADADCKVVK